jgi:hypothetical protein
MRIPGVDLPHGAFVLWHPIRLVQAAPSQLLVQGLEVLTSCSSHFPNGNSWFFFDSWGTRLCRDSRVDYGVRVVGFSKVRRFVHPSGGPSATSVTGKHGLDLSSQVLLGSSSRGLRDACSDQTIVGIVGELQLLLLWPQLSRSQGKKEDLRSPTQTSTVG